MTTTIDARPVTRGRPPAARRRTRPPLTPYVFISPFFVLYVAFLLGPTLFAMWLSLQQWAGIGDPVWVGLVNYTRLLSDSSFLTAAGNTFVFVLASVFIVMPLALVAATALNVRGLRGRDMFRVVYFLPIVLSPLLVSILFTIIFDSEFGLANAVLRGVVGLPPVDWLNTPGWARFAIVLVLIWRYTGYLMIYFLAGLQSIPREVYEAAQLDGAGALRQFWHVTVPMLRPVTAFVALTVVIGAAQIFEEPFILTQGGPEEATISVAMFIFRAAFERQQFGYAAAAGVVMFVVVFAVTKSLSRLLGVGREDEQ